MSKPKGPKHIIPNPASQLQNAGGGASKYKFGEASDSLRSLLNSKPVFAFDFLSLNGNEKCFNSQLVTTRDYNRLMQTLKELSHKTFKEIDDNRRYYHFHEVGFDDTTLRLSEFLSCLVADPSKVDADSAPTLYQIKAFEEARLLGFFYRNVFYLVYFDRQHNTYKRK